MASRALARLPRLKPVMYHRCTLPSLGRIGTPSSHRQSGDGREDDDRYARPRSLVAQARCIHVTRRNESTVLLAGAGVAVGALVARQGLLEYRKYKAAQPVANDGAEEEQEGEAATSDGGAGKASTEPPKGAASASGIFGAFGKRHYEGGFDEKMTRKEAALILGVRESAAPQRIKDAHRRILMINHPDKGGSKYMAAKINEAKEMLLKGRG